MNEVGVTAPAVNRNKVSLGSWLSPTIGAASGIAGSLLDYFGSRQNARDQMKFQSEENQKARDWQAAQADKQNAWNLDMWNRQNEYNSPSAQMSRLKAAGLNPDLMYGNGSAGGVGAAAHPAAAAGASPTSDGSALANRKTVGEVIRGALYGASSGTDVFRNILSSDNDSIEHGIKRGTAGSAFEVALKGYRNQAQFLDTNFFAGAENEQMWKDSIKATWQATVANSEKAQLEYKQYEECYDAIKLGIYSDAAFSFEKYVGQQLQNMAMQYDLSEHELKSLQRQIDLFEARGDAALLEKSISTLGDSATYFGLKAAGFVKFAVEAFKNIGLKINWKTSTDNRKYTNNSKKEYK